jgi:hypothetical protein
MSKPFVYDEKTSSLFSPNGEFLKKVFCPKAIHWNQLIVDDSQDRSRECVECKSRIINLDNLDTEEALSILSKKPNTCVSASRNSPNVIFLKDKNNPSSPTPAPKAWWSNDQIKLDLPIINTVRNFKDIQRAVQMGFWPDIWLVDYKVTELKSKFCLYQNINTGEVKHFGDYRMSSNDNSEEWQEVIPWTKYYGHYQELPLAAYLIPRDLPNNTEVLIPDPIEDHIGATWNQGNTYRASNVKAIVVNKKVVIRSDSIQREDLVG